MLFSAKSAWVIPGAPTHLCEHNVEKSTEVGMCNQDWGCFGVVSISLSGIASRSQQKLAVDSFEESIYFITLLPKNYYAALPADWLKAHPMIA